MRFCAIDSMPTQVPISAAQLLKIWPAVVSWLPENCVKCRFMIGGTD